MRAQVVPDFLGEKLYRTCRFGQNFIRLFGEDDLLWGTCLIGSYVRETVLFENYKRTVHVQMHLFLLLVADFLKVLWCHQRLYLKVCTYIILKALNEVWTCYVQKRKNALQTTLN